MERGSDDVGLIKAEEMFCDICHEKVEPLEAHTRKEGGVLKTYHIDCFNEQRKWWDKLPHIDYAQSYDDMDDMCEYCISIERSTPKSPRRKYIFCPMCGRERDV